MLEAPVTMAAPVLITVTGSFVNVKLDGLVQLVPKILMSVQIRRYLVLFAKMAASVRIDHRRLDFLATVHRNITAIHVHKSIMTVHKVNVVAKGLAWTKTELNMVLKLMNAFVFLGLRKVFKLMLAR